MATRSLIVALRRGWVRLAMVGIGAVVLVSLGAVAFSALSSPASGGVGGPATSEPCTPQPCLSLQGYRLWVSDVRESNGVVQMQVQFQNSSSATHADPADLRLIDAKKQSYRYIQDAPGCSHWSRTEFAKGARYGPVSMCFRPDSLAAPLTLEWNPDMGLVCCTADLKIK